MKSETVEIITDRRRFMRLPTRGRDPVFSLTRSWYYSAESAGLLKLHRVRFPGNTRGVTLALIDDVEKLLTSGASQ